MPLPTLSKLRILVAGKAEASVGSSICKSGIRRCQQSWKVLPEFGEVLKQRWADDPYASYCMMMVMMIIIIMIIMMVMIRMTMMVIMIMIMMIIIMMTTMMMVTPVAMVMVARLMMMPLMIMLTMMTT